MDFDDEKSDVENEPDGEVLIIHSDSESLTNDDDCDLPNATIQDVFSLGHEINSTRFDCVKPNIIYSLDHSNDSFKKLKFVVSPNLDKTFLHSPQGPEPDTIGTWDPEEFSSAKKYKWVPKAFSERQPKRVPFTIKDKTFNDFFKDEYLAAPNKKLSLPTGIFSPNTVTIAEPKTHCYEYWGRQGTLDAEITSNMLEFNRDLIKNVSELVHGLGVSKQNKPSLDQIKKQLDSIANFNTLALQSNYRSKSFAIQSCVKAKWDLRATVLDKFDGEESTREALMLSSFSSDKLFGPVPKAITDLKPNTCAGKSALLTSKVKFNSTKRQKSFVNPPSKRGKPSYDRNNFFDRGGIQRGQYGSRNSESVFHRGAKNYRKQRRGKGRGSNR